MVVICFHKCCSVLTVYAYIWVYLFCSTIISTIIENSAVHEHTFIRLLLMNKSCSGAPFGSEIADGSS